MPPPDGSPAVYKKRRLVVTLVTLLATVLIVLVVIRCEAGLQARALVGLLRETGPWAFFIAMALLPSIGFPLTLFTLPAGSAFGETMGLPRVLLLCSASIAVNVALAYWMARYALRPLVARLLAYLGYPVPSIPAQRQLGVAFLVRVTPGPPFFLQSCLLGLAEIRFLPYMFASWSVATAYAAAAIVGGDALMRKDVRAGLFALALLGALAILMKILRKKAS